MPKIDHAAIAALEDLEGTTPEKSLLEEVLTTYFESSPALVDKMKTSLAAEDLAALKAAAHSLKSSSALVGAADFSETCRTIETIPMIDDRARALVSKAASEFDAIVEDLKGYLRGER